MHATAYLKSASEHATGPIVVLSGAERFLKREAEQAVLREIFGDADNEHEVVRIAGKTANLATVVDALLTVSMWSPRQVVLVEDADDFVTAARAGLEKYLERPAKKSVLILDVKTWSSATRLAKTTAKIGLPIECSPLKPGELVAWLVDHCRQRQSRKLERPAAQLLVELAGTDLGLLSQELAKLSAFVGEKGAIDTEAVRTLVGGWKAETTWKMLDAVQCGDAATALELLDKLLVAGEHPLKLLGGINYSMRAAAQVAGLTRHGMPMGTAMTEAKVKPFAIPGLTAYLRRMGRERVEQFYRWLLQADLDIKGSSALSDRVIMERLVLQLSGRQ
jgi:DNA polymerase-3 subunit delta